MKFIAPTKDPIHVALTSGHTAVITQEGVDLAQQFHRAAIERGARPAESTSNSDLGMQQLSRALAVKDGLRAAISGNDPADFTKDGKPDLRRLTGRLGFPVHREEVDAAWMEVTAAA